MQKIFPDKLKAGDEVRVVAPSQSLAIISEESRKIANNRLFELGLKVSFGKYVLESDEFLSALIKHRVQDLHEAFSDSNIKAILTVIGGFNSNQLLRYIDWDLIKQNPKIFCGFSDVTALNNAILAKTGLINYSGPHYSTFGQELYFDYTLEYFKKCFFSNEPLAILASPQWSDDVWYKNQNDRNLIDNEGFWLINEGEAAGVIFGGNLCTFNLLQGTEYFPNLENSILFLEDTDESLPHTFDRDLQSLIHQPVFEQVKGIVIGRFQKASQMLREKLVKIIKTKSELANMPVIANVDFGHTDPKIAFPIGGEAILKANVNKVVLEITKH